MVRKLKHHEQKLLRKVDFTTYKSDARHLPHTVSRRYSLPSPATYTAYNRLCGSLRQLAHLLSLLPPLDPLRAKHTALLLDKLADMGILPSSSPAASKLSDVPRKVTVSAFCRRRLGVVMTRLKMSATVSAADRFIEQGHVRVGPHVVTDPAFLVTRSLEDAVTWAEGSKVKRSILRYRHLLDDFDLL
ncbi:MAG: hypothetical protein LQ351_000713 [Letrouitia transgressa]|nr:MAG: hypothetical protein LQ351_000713 [Letrouitia transgressa]